jgi:glyoxylase-like metal-dependent hydrolase (beta-lactamase superfamily II)
MPAASALLLVGFALPSVAPVAQEPAPTFTFAELAPGVLAALVVSDPPHYAFANSLVVHLGGGLLVVDTQQSPDAAAALIAEIRSRWSEPVRWVVNTHWHGDHVYGNIAYRRAWPEVEFLGHVTLTDDIRSAGHSQLEGQRAALPAEIAERRRWLAENHGPDGATLTATQRLRLERSLALRMRQAEQLRALELVPPSRVFADTLTVAGSERVVRLLALGPAHTRGDVVVWLPAERIAAVGDLVEDAYPWIEGANVRGWAGALERILSLEAAVLLPAHGAPWQASAARLAAQRDVFIASLEAACRGTETLPPALTLFRQLHALPAGEPEQRFWRALVAAARPSSGCEPRGA